LRAQGAFHPGYEAKVSRPELVEKYGYDTKFTMAPCGSVSRASK
jgi:hypothetical protein